MFQSMVNSVFLAFEVFSLVAWARWGHGIKFKDPFTTPQGLQPPEPQLNADTRTKSVAIPEVLVDSPKLHCVAFS